MDPAQGFQTVPLTDLTLTFAGIAYAVEPGAVANYVGGVLDGLWGRATPPESAPDALPLVLENLSVIQDGGWDAVEMAVDGADTQATFELPDGTAGAISYAFDWEQVDPGADSQSFELDESSGFNINVAGQNLAYGIADYTSPPALVFQAGQLVDIQFAVALAEGALYAGLSAVGGTVTALSAGGGDPLTAAIAVADPSVVVTSGKTTGIEKNAVIQFELKNSKNNPLKVTDFVTEVTIGNVKLRPNQFTQRQGDGGQTGTVTIAEAGLTGKHDITITVVLKDGTVLASKKTTIDFGK